MKALAAWAAGWAFWWAMPGLAGAHLTLYHNLEVNLVEPGAVQFYAIVHAPDLAGRTPEEFLRQTYRLSLEPWPAFQLDPAGGEGLPEECTMYRAQAPNPGGTLEVSLDAKSEKRLMLVITRPAAFPQTRDVMPGTSFAIPLPDPPPPPPVVAEGPAQRTFPIAWAGLALLLPLVFLWVKRFVVPPLGGQKE